MPNSRYPELTLDLTFQPVRCDRPAGLTAAQIDRFNREGYLAGIRLIEGDALARLKEMSQRSRDALRPILNPHTNVRWVYDVARGEPLGACLRDLLGDNVICFISQYIDKPPGSKVQVPGHQDSAFNAMDARAVIAWLAIEDVDTGNGCMWFCPGSHLDGAREIKDPKGDLNVADAELADAVRRRGKVPVELKAGQAVLFSDLMIHMSPVNPSPTRTRAALTFTFTAAETVVHAHPAARHAPVLCHGRNVGSHWTLLPPPAP